MQVQFQRSRLLLLISVSLIVSLILWLASSITPTHATATLVRVDSGPESVGQYTSLALNSGGNPVISYYDATNGDLKLAVCNDVLCSSSSLIIIDKIGDVGQHTSLVLDRKGFPVISYYDATNGDLKVAVCNDALCSSPGLTTVDSAGTVGKHTSLALNSNGNPVISYFDDTYAKNGLKVAVCGNTTCTSGNTLTTVESGPTVGEYNSLALNSSGNPVISYWGGSLDLRVAVCGNATCTSGNTLTSVDSHGYVGTDNSLALNSSGFPVISYFYDHDDLAQYFDLKVAVCGNATCTSGNTITTIAGNESAGAYSSLVLNSSGYPIISSWDLSSAHLDLKVAVCRNATCTNSVMTTVDSVGDVGRFTSAKVRSDGRLFVSYYDATNGDLKLYTDDTIALPPTATLVPSNTSTFTQSNTPTVTMTPSQTSTNTPTFTPSDTSTHTNTPIPLHADTIGAYKNGSWYLRDTNNSGSQGIFAVFGGEVSDLPVVGDWNSDGSDGLGIYRGNVGQFILSNGNVGILVENYRFTFGNPGDTPFAGRWTADMTHDGIGVYRNSNGILYQRKSLTSGFDDFFAVFGNPGDQAVAGDWEGNGFDSIGIYRSSNQMWYLTNNSTPAGITFSDIDFMWDISTNAPVVGDWDGNGDTTVGYLTGTGVFDLHSLNANAGMDTVFAFGPMGGKPIAGKWIVAPRPSMSNVIGESGTTGVNPDINGNSD